MTVVLDVRLNGSHGIGRHTRELDERLPPSILRLRDGPTPTGPLEPLWLRHYITSTDVTLFVSSLFNVPLLPRSHRFIPTIHDLIHMSFPGAASKRKLAYYRFHLAPAVRRASAVMTVSEASAIDIASRLKLDDSAIRVVGSGISDAFHPANGSDHIPRADGRPIISAIVSDRPHKNLALLFKACRGPRFPAGDVELQLVGPTRLRTYALRAMEGSRIKVRWLGPQNDETLADVYRRSSVFVSSSRMEGLGLPPLEAIACGTQAVVTRIPAHVESMGDNPMATFFDPCDPDELTDAVAIALSRHKSRAQEGSRIVRRRFNWDNTASRVLDVIREHDP